MPACAKQPQTRAAAGKSLFSREPAFIKLFWPEKNIAISAFDVE
jgi:hypothetical protein